MLLEIEGLRKYYPIFGGVFKRKVNEVKAVDDVSISIFRGECFGLVGESGCGKTTLGKTIIRLLKPDAGHIYFDVPQDILKEMKELESDSSIEAKERLEELREKYDITRFEGRRLKRLRRRMQIVFQDPTTSLNPRMLVKDIVGEPLKVQGLAKGREVRERVVKMLEKVGLTDAHLYRYPHEFSGGQRQRIAIARALITNPDFVVLDEPTSSVDVSVRAQLLKLFRELQKEFDLTYLFISHDLSVIECISDRVGVMYLGKIIEVASTRDIYNEPLHPYAKALMAAVPIPDPTVRKMRPILRGEVPSPVNPPPGCRFHPRCPHAMEICKREVPPLAEIERGRLVSCWLYIKG